MPADFQALRARYRRDFPARIMSLKPTSRSHPEGSSWRARTFRLTPRDRKSIRNSPEIASSQSSKEPFGLPEPRVAERDPERLCLLQEPQRASTSRLLNRSE